jgi:hypothetical protein
VFSICSDIFNFELSAYPALSFEPSASSFFQLILL